MQQKLETIGETQNMYRVTYTSGNVFEGQVSEWIPHNAGRLCLDDDTIYEVTRSRLNVNTSLHTVILTRIS